jgi:hypothetical protein
MHINTWTAFMGKMTSDQLRMARALLRIGTRELAAAASVDKMTITRIEAGGRAHASTQGALRSALEELGCVFIDETEAHGPAVALRPGVIASKKDEKSAKGDDGDDSILGRAWDDDLRAAMVEAWSRPGRWANLSAPSRAALSKAMFGDPEAGDEAFL